MPLFGTAAPQHNCHNWLKVVATTVAKRSYQNELINIAIIINQYLEHTIESGTWVAHGEREISQRVHIKNADQKILSGVYRARIFNNLENKKDLIKLVLILK